MSEQRPTPETDAAWASWPYAGPGVHANFARKLERERDEAQERAESKHGLWMAELSRVTELEKQLEAMREAVKEAWIQIQYAEAGFAGLAMRVCPNDSAVESVLNRMTEALAKLQPFLKP